MAIRSRSSTWSLTLSPTPVRALLLPVAPQTIAFSPAFGYHSILTGSLIYKMAGIR
jgi:hypothetical protein